jgi:hypothetical protein
MVAEGAVVAGVGVDASDVGIASVAQAPTTITNATRAIAALVACIGG